MAKSRNILPPRRFWLDWEVDCLRATGGGESEFISTVAFERDHPPQTDATDLFVEAASEEQS
jgi:hypothetical protein